MQLEWAQRPEIRFTGGMLGMAQPQKISISPDKAKIVPEWP